MRRNSPAKSPIRKQLVKKIVSYYDTLEHDRSASRSRSPLKMTSQGSKTKLLTSPAKKPKYMKDKNLENYDAELHRNAKLSKLENLMKHELVRGINEGTLEYNEPEMQKSIAGYPTFMKEKEDRLKFKEKQRKDLDQVDEVEFKDPIHQKLKEKVDEAEKDFISEAEDIDDSAQYQRGEDDVYDDKLYHLNTKKNYVHPNAALADHYDFHQRKSKEIRRLQYSAGLGKIRIIRYPVWVVFERIPYPANIVVKLGNGKKKAEQLQITEGDKVHIELNEIEGAPENTPRNHVLPGLPKIIKGISNVPVEDDGDCDFVAIPETGSPRWPVMITYREIPPYRDVEDTNCEIFGPDGISRGRARFNLLDGQNCLIYSKGFMADNQNNLSLVLVKRISDHQVLVKVKGRNRKVELVNVEEILYFEECDIKLTVLTLEENYRERLPRQIYFVDGMDCLENIELLTGEEGLAICTDCNDYRGKVQYDGGAGFRLNLYPSENWSDEFVRVVMDDNGKGPDFFDVVRLNQEILNVLKLRYGGPWVIEGVVTEKREITQHITTTGGMNTQTMRITMEGANPEHIYVRKGGKPQGINQEVLRRKTQRTPVKTSTSKISHVSSKKASQLPTSQRGGKRVLGVVEKPTTRIVESTYIGNQEGGDIVEETHIEISSGTKKSSQKKSKITYTTSGQDNVSSFQITTKKTPKKTTRKKVTLTKQQVNLKIINQYI